MDVGIFFMQIYLSIIDCDGGGINIGSIAVVSVVVTRKWGRGNLVKQAQRGLKSLEQRAGGNLTEHDTTKHSVSNTQEFLKFNNKK